MPTKVEDNYMRPEMNQDSELYPLVRFSMDVELEDVRTEELDSYIIKCEGKIFPDEHSEQVGLINVRLLKVMEAEINSVNLIDLLDVESTTSELMPIVGKYAGMYSDEVQEALGYDEDSFVEDIIYIERVEVDASYKGRRLGIAAIQHAIRVLGSSCGIAVLKAYPLQFEVSPHTQSSFFNPYSELDEEAAIKSLSAHYEKIGFKLIGDGPLMGRKLTAN